MEYETGSREVQWAGLLGGLALGALAMYIADPSQGRRRRALLQDKVSSVTNQTSHAVSQKLRDTRNRLSGLQAEASHLFSHREAKPIDDHVLEARVRSRLGRALSHRHQIDVSAHAGTVRLSGPVSADEMERLVELVEAIPGVEAVQHELHELHDQTGFMSARSLRNKAQRARHMLQGRGNWWMAGVGALFLYGLSRRAPLGLGAAAALALLMRASTREELGHRLQQGAQAVMGVHPHETEQSIVIHAAPESVFDIWSRYENFPHFMSNVIEVRDLGQKRSHWVVRGPAGASVEWDTVLTESERPRHLAWHSEPGSVIQQQGSVQLEAVEGGTRAIVKMSWSPAGGAVGALTGSDPARMLAEDLQRMKQFIERGLPVRESPAAGKESGPIFH